MITFPTAKINLGLQILRRRGDGFHELQTVFYPVGWSDGLEVIRAGSTPFRMTMSGLAVDGDPENNLCYRAWKMLAADFNLPCLEAHLHKVIPMGAGLGGGSSDAAFMLKLLNEVCELQIPPSQLSEYAARLGSDCAFFIQNVPAYATGRGEILEEYPSVLKGYYVVVLMPDITVPTAAAFSWITPGETKEDLRELLQLPVSEWKGRIINDFEEPVGKRYPVIPGLVHHLYSKGSLYAAMSGSGAAVFGVFEKATEINLPNVNSWQGAL